MNRPDPAPLAATAARGTLWPRTFQALRHRDFRLFWLGQLVSLVGTWMQNIAQSWLVLELSKSSFILGLVSAIGMLPVLMFSLPAGVVVDHINKRRMLIVTQSAMMGLALILASLTAFQLVRVWHIVLLAGALGIVNAFDMPCRQAFFVELVGRQDLLNAIALNSTAFNTARILGPAIAGFLIGTVGVAACFYINAASFVAVILGLALLRPSAAAPGLRSVSILRDMLTGLRYIGRNRDILTLIALVGVFSVFGIPYLMLMPVMARNILATGAQGYGILMSATGVGALIGALGLATFSNVRQRGRLVLLSGLVFVVFVTLFALSRSLLLSSGLLVVVGCTMVIQSATANSLLQTLAPDELRGRVMSVFTLMFVGLAPVGSFQAGLIAEHLTAPVALMLGAGVMALATALVIVLRRQMSRL